jgi:hypothetical protein
MSLSRVLLFAGPLLWGVMILFHPLPAGDSPYEGIRTTSTGGYSSTSDNSS